MVSALDAPPIPRYLLRRSQRAVAEAEVRNHRWNFSGSISPFSKTRRFHFAGQPPFPVNSTEFEFIVRQAAVPPRPLPR